MNKKIISEVMAKMGKRGGERRSEILTSSRKAEIAAMGGSAKAENRRKRLKNKAL